MSDKNIIKPSLLENFERFLKGPFSLPLPLDLGHCNCIYNTYTNSHTSDPDDPIKVIIPPIKIRPSSGPSGHYISFGPSGRYISFDHTVEDARTNYMSPLFGPEVGPDVLKNLINVMENVNNEQIRAAILSDFSNPKPKAKILLKRELLYGEKCYRIVSIENVKGFQELPKKYTGGNTCFYRRECESVVVDLFSSDVPHVCTIKPGELISEDLKKWIERCMKNSVEELKRIRREHDKLKRDWVGKKEVIEI